jgi:hypothetical protein
LRPFQRHAAIIDDSFTPVLPDAIILLRYYWPDAPVYAAAIDAGFSRL